jgi:hypothetical protein
MESSVKELLASLTALNLKKESDNWKCCVLTAIIFATTIGTVSLVVITKFSWQKKIIDTNILTISNKLSNDAILKKKTKKPRVSVNYFSIENL